jgi:predicted nucleic acid-binding protein
MEFVIGMRRDLQRGVLTLQQYGSTLGLLANLPVIQIDVPITSKAIDIRSNSLIGGTKSVKLPDAIVFATALSTGRYMVTRDPKGFVGPSVRVPYQIWPTGLVLSIDPAPPI